MRVALPFVLGAVMVLRVLARALAP